MAGFRSTLRSRAAVALAAFLALLLLGSLAACGRGADPWSGTWKSTDLFQVSGSQSGTFRSVLKIAKSGDGWTVTDVKGQTSACKEVDGKLVQTAGAKEVLERKGDKLVLVADGTVVMEFSKQ